MSTMYSTGKAAADLGVSVKMLQRWDREGRLTPERTDTGRRMDPKASLDGCMRRTPGSVKAPASKSGSVVNAALSISETVTLRATYER